ncbi:MAG: hypothetical protein PHR35_04165 [Kiritimatiellae bacterium]|nr:hypothetical protein [Kiritimatiellia bacterium]
MTARDEEIQAGIVYIQKQHANIRRQLDTLDRRITAQEQRREARSINMRLTRLEDRVALVERNQARG